MDFYLFGELRIGDVYCSGTKCDGDFTDKKIYVPWS